MMKKRLKKRLMGMTTMKKKRSKGMTASMKKLGTMMTRPGMMMQRKSRRIRDLLV